MIEITVLKYLEAKLEVPVSLEVPEHEKKYVVIEKTGGAEEHLCTATLAIQSYADRLYDAMLLNSSVKKAMAGITQLNEITKCSLNTDYNFTDTTTKKYRYQAVFNITYYEEEKQ